MGGKRHSVRDDGVLNVGVGGIWNPTYLTHIGGFNKEHSEFPKLEKVTSLACPENQLFVVVVRENAIR